MFIQGPPTTKQYRVIHKFLRDFRALRYSSRDGHAEGEQVNIDNQLDATITAY